VKGTGPVWIFPETYPNYYGKNVDDDAIDAQFYDLSHSIRPGVKES
jgi:hypothetical protein